MSHFLTVVLIEPPDDKELAVAGVRGEMKAAEQVKPTEFGGLVLEGEVPIDGDAKALRTYAEECLEGVLDRYDENHEVDPYETECWCLESGYDYASDKLVGEAATYKADVERLRAQLQEFDARVTAAAGGEVDLSWVTVGNSVATAIKAVGERPALLELVDAEKALADEWKAVHADWNELLDSTRKQAPRYGLPDPTCETCHGSGRRTTTSNPEGRWDWWVIGGRWAGVFRPEYDPAMDARNMLPCNLCAGHVGKRYWHITPGEGGAIDEWEQTTPDDPDAQERECNGCQGTGTRRRFGNAEFDGDVVPVDELVALIDDGKFTAAYALVTPDGEWHGQGRTGWFGTSRDDMTDEEWHAAFSAAVRAYAGRSGDAEDTAAVEAAKAEFEAGRIEADELERRLDAALGTGYLAVAVDMHS